MQSSGRLLPAAGLMTALVFGILGCNRQAADTRTPEGRLRVAASIFPIGDVLSRVGGDRVDTIILLPPGESPHHFEPSPQQAEELARSAVLVAIGLGVDDWSLHSSAAVGGKCKTLILGKLFTETDLNVADATGSVAGETAAADHAHDHACDHDHHAGPGDPHIWLDPVKMLRVADAVARTLGEADPEGQADYSANADAYKKRLQELDRHCAQQTKALPRKEFVTFHAAFGHFAKRYGLRQIALRWVDATEPAPKQIERVVQFIQQNKVRTMFAEPQFPVEQLDAIAKQTGVEVDRLDPLGAPGVIGHDSYIELMKTNLATLVQGLSN